LRARVDRLPVAARRCHGILLRSGISRSASRAPPRGRGLAAQRAHPTLTAAAASTCARRQRRQTRSRHRGPPSGRLSVGATEGCQGVCVGLLPGLHPGPGCRSDRPFAELATRGCDLAAGSVERLFFLRGASERSVRGGGLQPSAVVHMRPWSSCGRAASVRASCCISRVCFACLPALHPAPSRAARSPPKTIPSHTPTPNSNSSHAQGRLGFRARCAPWR
jgi:hypothetical protein